jgi:hypothetical protein
MRLFASELRELAIFEDVNIEEIIACAIAQGYTKWYLLKSEVLYGETEG